MFCLCIRPEVSLKKVSNSSEDGICCLYENVFLVYGVLQTRAGSSLGCDAEVVIPNVLSQKNK